ncbi:MAG: SEC-C domain-containing protein, partial [Desulfovibrio sp.]|nr:SEC-C domain-containing protein [Desulfovibrio sp.]
LEETLNLGRVLKAEDPLPEREEAEELFDEILKQLAEESGELFPSLMRYFLLEELDRCWKEHLRSMDALRDGIGLRGYGQTDPKQAYQREGFTLFQDMLFRIREGVLRTLSRLRVVQESEGVNASIEVEAKTEAKKPAKQAKDLKHKTEQKVSYSHGKTVEEQPAKHKPVSKLKAVGRNDPCPCGSGKKYKKCCGRNR